MRIKVNLSKSLNFVPKNNQQLLNSYVHKCLGRNNIYHDSKSDYSISTLKGFVTSSNKDNVNYGYGAYFIVSSLNMDFISKLVLGLLSNKEFGFGMKFDGIDHIDEQLYDGWNHFNTLSPFIIKQYEDKKDYSFLQLGDKGFKNKVKSYLKNKLSKVDYTLDLSDFDVQIPEHPSHRVCRVQVKNVANFANKCQISIHTNKRVATLLYNIGLGQSTGSGFGTIYKTENHRLYELKSE